MRSKFIATEYQADRMCWETSVISKGVACAIRETLVLHPKVFWVFFF